MTLAELLVASILMGIVMVGVISVNYAMKRMESTTSKATLLGMQTAAAMNHITRNGLLAVGYENNPGIVLALNTPPDTSYLSFRQDTASTPGDFSDDQWVIYTDIGEANHLYTCTQDAATGPVPQAAACDPAQSLLLLDNLSLINYQLVRDDTVPSTYLEVHIQTQFDVTQPADPVRNPTYDLTTQISPPFHSWSN